MWLYLLFYIHLFNPVQIPDKRLGDSDDGDNDSDALLDVSSIIEEIRDDQRWWR